MLCSQAWRSLQDQRIMPPETHHRHQRGSSVLLARPRHLRNRLPQTRFLPRKSLLLRHSQNLFPHHQCSLLSRRHQFINVIVIPASSFLQVDERLRILRHLAPTYDHEVGEELLAPPGACVTSAVDLGDVDELFDFNTGK
jgi:hypothetical protein